ncbi:MAG: ribosomal-processing cysteine protease Prp [Clostridia bacterium]|nr:ribosomal-processing cysteine protease Prp [Clostridia bacterium]
MTSISYTEYYEAHIFECVGHTGYSTAGNDILCSAVSCLCYTLDAYLRGCVLEGKITHYVSEFNEGNVRIQYEYTDICNTEALLEAVRAILGGFILLEENFPDHINVDV